LSKSFYIKQFCTIRNQRISVNDHEVFTSEDVVFSDFSKAAYRHFGLSYPKFFKMDNLSKLAFMASDLILKDYEAEENDVALVFANKSSSLDTDSTYQKSISNPEEYYPSPAVFVYTLPNICLGEISIKYKLYSENSFFVFESFNPSFFKEYAEILLKTGKAKEVLCGWVELLGDTYDAFVYLISEEGQIVHTEENIKKLYQN
jgi:hypothetical protein